MSDRTDRTDRTDRDQAEHLALIERELAPVAPNAVSRRAVLTSAAAAAAVTALMPSIAEAAKIDAPGGLTARVPEGFTPFIAPGRVVKVTKADTLQNNKLYPKPEAAKEMLTRALTELTGKPDLVSAVAQFVHKDDIVCVKVNGIAQAPMATNRELVLPFIEAMIESGVSPEKITVLEQYAGFFNATRISAQNLPKGVKISTHGNKDAKMPERMVPGTATRTQFATALTEATAAINFALVKDHSICGYTGALKNMTHGCTLNPHAFHVHHASPQIALLYAQDVIKSRVRLCIADAYKVMYDGGPLYKRPEFVKPYESVYVSTDPVAMDTVGWDVVEKLRAERKMKTLAEVGREPAYIKAAETLGLGIHDRDRIHLKEVVL